jgi:uncharacterized membrane protein YeaQ/YmgE (transglycosylase-associated protein family)
MAEPPGIFGATARTRRHRGDDEEEIAMIGALLLGLVAGFIGRALVPNDIFAGMHGPRSWLVSIVLGLVGAFAGYLIFTRLLGIGDNDAFDWGGILSAIIGVIIVLLIAGAVVRRTGHGPGPTTPYAT